ncbi:hypothetical protein Drorol1_Dr00025387 [Drosera rotundifolia]
MMATVRAVKREPLATMNRDVESTPSPAVLRAVKRERETERERERERERDIGAEELNEQAGMDRRALRSRYLAVKNLICYEKEDLYRGDSDKFRSLIKEVENLHQQVRKPREQVADAEALLDIANSLVTSVRSQSKEGITPSDLITCLIRDFGEIVRNESQGDYISLKWSSIGLLVSSVFMKADGCSTMVGPMNAEMKQRKVATHRRRGKINERAARPEELRDTGEEKTDTDKNMAIIFQILKTQRHARLENLILNRRSFAQTVENLFALSFLVKDGRVQINVDEKGTHLISPRNAPAANLISSGQVAYSHFVFKFNFQGWKLMLDTVPVGEELMPDREKLSMPHFQA